MIMKDAMILMGIVAVVVLAVGSAALIGYAGYCIGQVIGLGHWASVGFGVAFLSAVNPASARARGGEK
jgi:hypothetical protein